MSSFDVLSRDLNIFERRLIEASAGTGKTFAIEHLVVRFLLSGVSIDQILVVTFTRAATRELKERIRSNVERARRLLCEGDCSLGYLAALVELGEQKKGARLLEEALMRFEEAQVYTIHGFCYRMLKEFSFDTIPEELPEHKPALRKAIFDFLRTGLKPSLYSTGQVQILLKGGIEQLVEKLLMLLDKGKNYPELPTFAQLHEKLNALSPHTPAEFDALLKEKKVKKSGAEEIVKEAKDYRKLLLRCARDCQGRVNKPSQMAPDQLLVKMKEALGKEDFLLKVREKYRIAIIDEFQDTDKIQWEIFHNLFHSLSAFYVVGDPKQSIYGFRNADVYTYLKAAESVKEKGMLKTNFRASSPLVSALNRLFAGTSIPLPSLNASLEIPSVNSAREGEGGVHFFVGEGEESFFPFIAQKVQELSGISAILVKDRYQGARMQAYLEERGIAAQLERGELLKEMPEFLVFQDVVEVLSKRKTEAFPRIAQSILFRIKPPDEVLYRLSELFINKGFPQFYRAFLQLPEVVVTPVLLQIGELILEGKLETDEEEVRQKEGGVRILTMHMSKGLEFDNVFALGVACRQKSQEDWVCINDKIQVNDLQEEACRHALKEQEAEKLRLFYVAMTRAKRELYVPLIPNLDPPEPGEASPLELFLKKPVSVFLQETGFPHTFLTPLDLPKKGKKRKRVLLPNPTPLAIIPQSSSVLSFSSLAQSLGSEKKEVEESALPLGPDTGVLIHALFEAIFSAGIQKDEEKIRELVRQEIAYTPFVQWEQNIFSLVWDALHLVLAPETFSLQSVTSYLQEMEFLYPYGKDRLKGFADLVFTYEGRYFLLDWKTNALGNYSQEEMEKEMAQHDYYLQAALYTKALEKYVKLFDKRPFAECFGGAFYLFLRGRTSLFLCKDLLLNYLKA